MHKKAICYFGSYDPDYSRNRVIIKGLERNGMAVFQCQNLGAGVSHYLTLFKLFLQINKRVNIIIVGFPGHYDLPLAHVLGKIFKKKVVYDIFASKYETYVLDKKVISKYSPSALFFWIWDKICLAVCDFILIDTKSHGELYKKLYKVSDKKMILVYVGTDDDIFYPSEVKENNDVLFYGSYQPLQGTQVIIEAAKLLPKLKFKMIGDGQTKRFTENLAKKYKLKNVKFEGWIPIKNLAKEINKSKIILGIFGESEKAKSVIPNKVYDGLACKKVVVTSRTHASLEFLKSNKNSVLTKKSSGEELKNAIERLLKKEDFRKRIAKEGFDFYTKKLKPKEIVKDLLKI